MSKLRSINERIFDLEAQSAATEEEYRLLNLDFHDLIHEAAAAKMPRDGNIFGFTISDSFIAQSSGFTSELPARAREAERAASGEYRVPRGELLVTAPIMFGKLHVAPIAHEFLAAYPDVTLRLVLSDQVIDLAEAMVDVAVRIGRLPDSDLIARQVGHVCWIFCASETYLARRGTPATPEALAKHDCIAFEGLQTYRTWPAGAGPAEKSITIRPRFSVNTADAVVDAAASGLGVARIMSYQAADAIVARRIKPILRSFSPPPIPVSLIHQPRRSQPLKRRAFLDFVAPRLTVALVKVDQAVSAK